jgi:hypothetical protein
LLLERLESRVVPGFLAPLAFDAGSDSRSVAVGDFIGNGHLDLAVANEASNDVSVLLGNGDGTFQPARNYAVGSNPMSVAVGDFNGDGRLDLVVANVGTYPNQGTVSVLLGNGDGTFQAARNFPAGIGPFSVAVGDLDRDGHLDLAVANYGGGSVSVLLGNGDGTFQPAREFSVGGMGYPTPSVAVGDFNEDGRLDLAVGGGRGTGLHVLLGNGDGTFQPARDLPITGDFHFSVAVGDFIGNGHLDLAVANYSKRTVSVLLGNGDGTFQPAVNYAVMYPRFVAVGDFNGDGRLDLAVANGGGTVSVLLGNGDGTFQAAVNYTAGGSPYSVAVGDFVRNGHLDLAVANGANVGVLLGNGDGTFQAAPNFPAGESPGAVAEGDFIGNGRLDVAVANYFSGTVSVLLGNGDGTFRAAVNYAVVDHPTSVAVGDFDGDGTLDLAVANQGTDPDHKGTVSVLLGNGDGTFQPARTFNVGTSPTSVAVGDFDGDGHLDLAVANAGTSPDFTDSSVSVLLGNGDGTFQPARTFNVGTSPTSVAVGDFDGDGHLDLAVANGGTYNASYMDSSVSVLLGNGDGSFQPARNFLAGSIPSWVAVADFNGDGHLDLAVANFVGTVSVLLGNGDGTFQAAVDYGLGGASSVAVGDFNGDGRLDLAVVFNGEVRVLRGNGDGTFQTTPVSYIAGGYAVAVGDFNGDGFPDLAVPNPGSNAVSILLNDGVWPGPSPPPGGGGCLRDAVRRPGTSPVSRALSVADWVHLDPGVPATAAPFGAAPPSGDVPLPLLDSGAAKGQRPAAGAAVAAAPPPAPVLARAERTARGLVDRLFTAWESGWLDDRSAGTLRLLGS